MRKKRSKITSGGLALVCLLGVAVAAVAADIPFWGNGSSLPVRTPASAVVSSVAASLDSRTVQAVESAAVKFNSSRMPGLVLILR